MPKRNTQKITTEQLKIKFRTSNIWAKINNGDLTSEVISSKVTPSKYYVNSMSEIIKHFDRNGKHIATTHRIVDIRGKILHWDERNIYINDICFWID